MFNKSKFPSSVTTITEYVLLKNTYKKHLKRNIKNIWLKNEPETLIDTSPQKRDYGKQVYEKMFPIIY